MKVTLHPMPSVLAILRDEAEIAFGTKRVKIPIVADAGKFVIQET